MKFIDLFQTTNTQPRYADRLDRPTPTLNLVKGSNIQRERHGSTKLNARVRLSALSAPILVPLDEPFVEGRRYRQARATEWRARLDLFVADPAGPWLRRHGVLLAVKIDAAAEVT